MKLATTVFLGLGWAGGALAQQSATQQTIWERKLRSASELASQGQYIQAETGYLAAIEEAEKFGSSDQRLALSLASIAVFYMEAGHTEKALPFATRALSIRDASSKLAAIEQEIPNAGRFQTQKPAVFINGVALPPDTMRVLAMRYGIQPPAGRYWYDRVSGAWGHEGGPMAGQVAPNLPFGGPLHPNASGGGTNVFVNGREIHYMDVANLQRCTPVYPGRYWVNAQGIGGYEGRPPSFNLAVLCGQASGSGGRTSSGRTWQNGDGSWSYHNGATGLGAISDGKEIFITGK